ncbi:MAG: AAA family ATPase [Magnetococcales bacterium]|nr:AAA family ATPase [Magnetococcales bacterium]
MIILRLRSENILRFKRLDLNGLPERGRILIAGSNESGKSAILETLSLAIFGRTSNLTCDTVHKAVRWGADNASVTLDFIGNDDARYSLFRYFDGDGIQRARLNRLDQETPLAQGVEAVNQAAGEAVGFDFQQFINALYLTHGRHSHPNPGETVKELAGVTALEILSMSLGDEIKRMEGEITARRTRLADTHEQIKTLDLRPETLGELEHQLASARGQAVTTASTIERWEGFDVALVHAAKSIETASTRLGNTSPDTGLAGWQSRSKQLDDSLTELEGICLGGHVEMESSPAVALRQWQSQLQGRLTDLQLIHETVTGEQNSLRHWLEGPPGQDDTSATQASRLEANRRQLQRGRQRQGVGAGLFLLTALIAWAGVWVVWEQQKNSDFAPVVLDLMARHLPLWEKSHTMALLPAAILSTLLLLWNLVGRWRKQGQINTIQISLTRLTARRQHVQATIAAINEAMTQSLGRQVEILGGMENTPWSADLLAWTRDQGRPFLDGDALRSYLATLDKRLTTFQSEIAGCREEAREQLLAAQTELAGLHDTVTSLEQAVNHEKARRQELIRLQQTLLTLNGENQRDERASAVRRIGRELLKGTCVGLSSHFNQELLRFSANTAPLFTQGRYRHLRLDEALNVTVFSETKNDFVQVEEISTGVRRQLTLAVRMALAQALATRTGGTHFIALDEPFAYFDRQRCRETLDALLRISDRITQIWIVGQEFDTEASATGLYIQCTLDQDVLVMTMR